jgi:hypothetical protein
MANDTASFTAGHIADYSAALLNDPAKTDYTFAVLQPFIMMAYYELVDTQMDGQQPPLIYTTDPLFIPKGTDIVYPANRLDTAGPFYHEHVSEIQEIGERPAGTTELFIPMKRTEHLGYVGQPTNRLRFWTWENEAVKFPVGGATADIELQFKCIRGLTSGVLPPPEMIIAGHNTHTYLIYKTAALAAMFIGENPERAGVLDMQAQKALERVESIDNKGRQQIMTRHRPFRATWKMRGGY